MDFIQSLKGLSVYNILVIIWSRCEKNNIIGAITLKGPIRH